MSGGHFQYKQWEIGNIADEVEQLILDNDSQEVNEYGDRKGYGYSPETIEEFKQGLLILRQAHVYAQRIDWLVSGDDGEDSFHRRLKVELEKV
jgi:hypothetical protein